MGSCSHARTNRLAHFKIFSAIPYLFSLISLWTRHNQNIFFGFRFPPHKNQVIGWIDCITYYERVSRVDFAASAASKWIHWLPSCVDGDLDIFQIKLFMIARKATFSESKRSEIDLQSPAETTKNGFKRVRRVISWMKTCVAIKGTGWKETVSFFRALCVWHFNFPNDALTSGCRREAARASASGVRRDSSSSRPRRDREQIKNLLSYQNLQWLSRIFVISFWIIYDSMRTLKNRAVLFFCTNNNFLRFLSATAKNHSIRGLKFNSIWKLNDNFYKRRVFLHKHIKTIYFLTRCKCIKNTTPPFKSALFANWAVTQHRNEPKPVR